MKVLCVGDAMIPGADFADAAATLDGAEVVAEDWETDWSALQHRRLVVEQQGPAAEPVPEPFGRHTEAELGLGLFCPWSGDGMDRLPRLRLIGVARAGIENVDVTAATERGIMVVNVMGRNAQAVSDFAIGMILAEMRNIARAHASIREGGWRKEFSNSDFVPELAGKTVGIVGFGHIGRLVARKLSGFDARILAFDPAADAADVQRAGATAVGLDELMGQSDVVTLHARLSADSRGLIGAEQIALMKPTAYIVNTARSGLIDTAALVAALRERRIAGAALDVFDSEPIPPDDPLLGLDNVTLTSHIAGTTTEALTRSPHLLVETIGRVLAGDPTALRNPAVLEREEVRAWLDERAAESSPA